MAATIKVCLEDKNGKAEKVITVNRLFNYGSAVRDPELIKKHHAEVKDVGVKIPNRGVLPRMYQMSPWILSTDEEIIVQGEKTSGEVELVFVDAGDDIYVGVGSDHSDREIERYSIHGGKQACPSVLAPKLWRLKEIEDHLDKIVMECEVETAGEKALYQKVNIDVFIDPRKLVSLIYERTSLTPGNGMVLFSGTVPSVDVKLDYADKWTIRLTDTVLNRKIEHTYAVVCLNKEIQELHNLPLILAEW